ncbi:MAG: 4Fe-4S dicluster domain-containing protein [Candidatus Altiarchaeota archaeon]
MKRIYAREEYCIGCRLCEVYCVTQHSKSKNIIKAYRDEPEAVPRLFVEESGHVSFAVQCRHCDDAPCIDACITGAMHLDPKTNAVLCDEEKCVGCWMCIMVCPFGVIRRNVTDRKIASKCDLCIGEGEPACVLNCPNEALVYEERKE